MSIGCNVAFCYSITGHMIPINFLMQRQVMLKILQRPICHNRGESETKIPSNSNCNGNSVVECFPATELYALGFSQANTKHRLLVAKLDAYEAAFSPHKLLAIYLYNMQQRLKMNVSIFLKIDTLICICVHRPQKTFRSLAPVRAKRKAPNSKCDISPIKCRTMLKF